MSLPVATFLSPLDVSHHPLKKGLILIIIKRAHSKTCSYGHLTFSIITLYFELTNFNVLDLNF